MTSLKKKKKKAARVFGLILLLKCRGAGCSSEVQLHRWGPSLGAILPSAGNWCWKSKLYREHLHPSKIGSQKKLPRNNPREDYRDVRSTSKNRKILNFITLNTSITTVIFQRLWKWSKPRHSKSVQKFKDIKLAQFCTLTSVIMDEHKAKYFLKFILLDICSDIQNDLHVLQRTFALITNTIIHCDKKPEEWNMPSQYPTNQLRVNDDIDITGSWFLLEWQIKSNCKNQKETSKIEMSACLI